MRAGRYDLILDFVACHGLFAYRRSLRRGGRYVMVGGHIRHIFQAVVLGALLSPGSRAMGLPRFGS